MTKSKLIKALLLNALVFPGSGYFVLNRRIRGLFLSLSVLVLLGMLVVQIFFFAFAIREQPTPVIAGDPLQQVLALSQGLSAQILNVHSEVLKIYGYLLLFCYGFGILDPVALFFLKKDQGAGPKIM